MSKNKWFRSSVCRQKFDAIVDDADNEIIKGVAVVSAGEVKGHGVNLDNDFLEKTVKLGNEKTQGIKARFGHPTMSSEALGTFVGRFYNFGIDGETARADLYLSSTAEKSPKGNLKEYILNMAESEPDMFGTSIVFTPGKRYQRDDNNNKIYVQSEWEDDNPVYIEIQSLHNADVVDDPAANDGMFSRFSDALIASEITQFIDRHPEILDLVEKRPDLIEPFLARYKQLQTHLEEQKTMDENTTKQEKTKTVNVDLLLSDERKNVVKEFKDLYNEFGDKAAKAYFDADGDSLKAKTECIKQLQDEVSELRKKVETQETFEGEDAVSQLPELSTDEVQQGKIDNRTKKLESKIGGNLAKFASSLTFK